MLKKNENFLSVIVKAGMPVVAIAGLVLSQFVTFGAEFSFGVTNTTKMVVCAVALFFFYVPIRDIFLQYFNGGERTRKKSKPTRTAQTTLVTAARKSSRRFASWNTKSARNAS